jgi:hypothetical protein
VSKRIALGGLALIIILAAICGKVAVDLRAMRHELQITIGANEFLKKTLGEMTVAIAAKQREIDRLTQTSCGGPDRGKVSGADAIRQIGGERAASGENELK